MVATSPKTEKYVVRRSMVLALLSAFRFLRAELPSAWIKAGNLSVARSEGRRAGQIDFSDAPWWYDILDWKLNDLVRMIGACAIAQLGKSFWLDASKAWHFRFRFGTILSIHATENEAKTHGTDRTLSMLQGSPGTRDLVRAEERSGVTQTIIRGKNCPRILFRWFGSRMSAKSTSAQLVQVDELDEVHKESGRQIKLLGDYLNRLLARTRAQPNGLVEAASTPTDEDKGIWAYWVEAQQWRPYVECPHCQHRQPWEFFQDSKRKRGGVRGIKDDKGQFLTPGEIVANSSAWYECRECGGRIEERDRMRLNRSAVTTCDTPERSNERRCIHLNAMYSPDETFSSIAAAYVAALDDAAKMVQFRQEWLALPRSSQRLPTPGEAQIMLHRDLTYQQGDAPGIEPIPSFVRRICFGVDVQMDSYYAVVRGFGYEGETALLGAWRFESMAEVRALPLVTWTRVDGETVRCTGGFIDSGARTQEVYQLCAETPGCLPIKGWRNRPDPLSSSMVDRKKEGRGWVTGEIELWHISNTYFSDIIAGYYERPAGYGAGLAHLPANVPGEYVVHILNERRVRKHGVNGVEVYWEPVSEGAENHLFDGDKYCLAYAHHKGFLNLPRPRPTVPTAQGDSPQEVRHARDFTRRTTIPTRPFGRGA